MLRKEDNDKIQRAVKQLCVCLCIVYCRQLTESRQKISCLTEQLERKMTVNSAAGDVHGSENGPDDVSSLKVHSYVGL